MFPVLEFPELTVGKKFRPVSRRSSGRRRLKGRQNDWAQDVASERGRVGQAAGGAGVRRHVGHAQAERELHARRGEAVVVVVVAVERVHAGNAARGLLDRRVQRPAAALVDPAVGAAAHPTDLDDRHSARRLVNGCRPEDTQKQEQVAD